MKRGGKGTHVKYILNSAVITSFGEWDYQSIGVLDAQRWMHKCIHFGCQGTAQWHQEPGCECLHASGQQDGETCRVCQGTGHRHAWQPRWESAIGYTETATALEQLCGLDPGAIPINRIQIKMGPGDEALVFRLALPQGSPRIDPSNKGQIAAHVGAGHWELGLLRHLA